MLGSRDNNWLQLEMTTKPFWRQFSKVHIPSLFLDNKITLSLYPFRMTKLELWDLIVFMSSGSASTLSYGNAFCCQPLNRGFRSSLHHFCPHSSPPVNHRRGQKAIFFLEKLCVYSHLWINLTRNLLWHIATHPWTKYQVVNFKQVSSYPVHIIWRLPVVNMQICIK